MNTICLCDTSRLLDSSSSSMKSKDSFIGWVQVINQFLVAFRMENIGGVEKIIGNIILVNEEYTDPLDSS